MQQRRLACARRRDERDHLARFQFEIGALEDLELVIGLDIGALDALQAQNALSGRHHSYLSASTGSSLAARQAGRIAAKKDRPSDRKMTAVVS